jgi:hypothetical protein
MNGLDRWTVVWQAVPVKGSTIAAAAVAAI